MSLGAPGIINPMAEIPFPPVCVCKTGSFMLEELFWEDDSCHVLASFTVISCKWCCFAWRCKQKFYLHMCVELPETEFRFSL